MTRTTPSSLGTATLRHAVPHPPATALDRAVEASIDAGRIDAPSIVSHPDGWYWQAPDGHQEIGPFESREAAQADRDAVGDDGVAPGDALMQTVREAGLGDGFETDLEAWTDDEPAYLRED